MNSQQFLTLNIVILVIFVVWFFAGRRAAAKKPTQLQMKKGNAPAPGGVLQKSSGPPTAPSTSKYSHPRYQAFLDSKSSGAGAAGGLGGAGGGSKELNVLFNYNGHTWDAYEVFGLPAGSNIVDVTKAYQNALRDAEPRSHEFLETAFRAILAKK